MRVSGGSVGFWRVFVLAASAWLLTYFVLRSIVGPLNPDEIYFGHTLWLVLQGKHQYADFFSQHFPTWFLLYQAVIPRPHPASLDFIWFVRLSNLAVLAGYVALLFWLDRKRALFLLPLLLTLIVISRMVEVRADTLGLVAFNAGWAVLLKGYSRPKLLVAALLAILGASFSARGLTMGVGFAASLAALALLHRDRRGLLELCGLALIAGGAAAAWYLAAPHYVTLLVRSTLLEPSTLLTHLTPAQRIVGFDRSPQILIVTAALAMAVVSFLQRKDRDRAAVVTIACAAQLLLIAFDPSPFPYVYAWAAIPSLIGLIFAEPLFGIDCRPPTAALGTAFAAALAVLVAGYPLIHGRRPPRASNYRVWLDPPLDVAALRQVPTERLAPLMLSGEGQQSLANQLAVRGELCRRFSGTTLSVWQNHPICLNDANYYWYELKWPNIWADGPPTPDTAAFETMFRTRPPNLVIWRVPGSTVGLNPWARHLLTDYRMYDGFALRNAAKLSS